MPLRYSKDSVPAKSFLRTDEGSTESSMFRGPRSQSIPVQTSSLLRESPRVRIETCGTQQLRMKCARSYFQLRTLNAEVGVYSTRSASTGLMAAARLAGK